MRQGGLAACNTAAAVPVECRGWRVSICKRGIASGASEVGCMAAAGVTVIGEVNAWTCNLMNLLWLVGTFTFATVIGIITEDVTQTIMVRMLP